MLVQRFWPHARRFTNFHYYFLKIKKITVQRLSRSDSSLFIHLFSQPVSYLACDQGLACLSLENIIYYINSETVHKYLQKD